MKKIFVTGAGGFIGKNFLETFGKSYEVSAPTHAELELADASAVETHFRERGPFDLVLHLANVGGKRNSSGSGVLSGNLAMFNNLLRCRNRFDRMIFLGSGAEYGKQRPLVSVRESAFDENVPTDEYGLAKYLCSKLSSSDDGILNLRVFGVFGPYEDVSVRFISNAICRILMGEGILLKQDCVFDYTDVRDLCEVIRACIDRAPPFRACNAGSGRRTSLRELAGIVRSVTGNGRPIRVLNPGIGREYTCDNSLLRGWMKGFEFRGFEESIRNLYEWYRGRIDRIDRNRIFFDG